MPDRTKFVLEKMEICDILYGRIISKELESNFPALQVYSFQQLELSIKSGLTPQEDLKWKPRALLH